MKKHSIVTRMISFFLFVLITSLITAQALLLLPSTSSAATLGVFVQSIDVSTGAVVVNGGDSKQPTTPFTFDWGDGTSINGWFPQSHTYQDKTRNYVVIVTSYYTDGTTDQANAAVLFNSNGWNVLENSDHTLASLSAVPYGINGTMVISYDKVANDEFLFFIDGGNNSNNLVSVGGLYYFKTKSDGSLWAADLNNNWSQIGTMSPLLPSNFASGDWNWLDNSDHTLATLSAVPYGINGTMVISYDKGTNNEFLFFIDGGNNSNNLVSIDGSYFFDTKSDGSLWAADLNNNWSQTGTMSPLLPSNFAPSSSLTITPVLDSSCPLNQQCTAVVANVTGGDHTYGYYYGSLAYGTTPWNMVVVIGDTMDHQNKVVLTGSPTRADHYKFQVCVHDLTLTEKCTMTELLVIPPPSCTYTLSSTSQSFGSAGGTGSVGISASSGCNWTATSNASWITITSGSSGSGNGNVNYTVAANAGTDQRTGTMTISGQIFTVTQAGAQSPGQNSMTWVVSDQCNNGYSIDFRFYDVTNNLVWPSSSTHYYENYSDTYQYPLACLSGAKVCIGASSGSLYWGVGLSGQYGCSDCCYYCDGGTHSYSFGCSSNSCPTYTDMCGGGNVGGEVICSCPCPPGTYEVVANGCHGGLHTCMCQ